jgi:hypothetical protein
VFHMTPSLRQHLRRHPLLHHPREPNHRASGLTTSENSSVTPRDSPLINDPEKVAARTTRYWRTKIAISTPVFGRHLRVGRGDRQPDKASSRDRELTTSLRSARLRPGMKAQELSSTLRPVNPRLNDPRRQDLPILRIIDRQLSDRQHCNS